MVKYKTIQATKDDLDYLYEKSALTIEGLDVSSIPEWLDQLEPSFTDDAVRSGVDFYIISGEFMNSVYSLTGTNAYPDDLTIVALKNLDYFKDSDIGKISMERFSYGGRWFDDIVDNNVRREKEKQ